MSQCIARHAFLSFTNSETGIQYFTQVQPNAEAAVIGRMRVPLAILFLQSYIQDFSTLPSQTSGLNSTIYAALTAAFVVIGFTYQFAPVNTMNAVFGMAAEKGLEDKYLWQLIGGSIATCVAPIAYTQRVSVFTVYCI